jgi:hypothetical protein
MAPPVCVSCGAILGPGSYVSWNVILCAGCAPMPWGRALFGGTVAALTAAALAVVLARSNLGGILGVLAIGAGVGVALRKVSHRRRGGHLLAVALSFAAIVTVLAVREELRRTPVIAAAVAALGIALLLTWPVPPQGPFDPGPLDPPPGVGV